MATEKVKAQMQEINEAWAGLRHIALAKNIRLAISFTALNIVDTGITQMAINNGGLELNPLMRLFLEQSPWVFWWVKISLSAIIALVLFILDSKYPQQIRRIFLCLITAMAGVCAFNLAGVVL